LQYTLGTRSVRLLKERPHEANGRLATFFEWASKADEEGYADL
jgi:hypothetical protein